MKFIFIALLTLSLWIPRTLVAAVGCTLSSPAEDLKYLYPEMTSFKEQLFNFETLKEGKLLFEKAKERIGSDLDPVYETFETPYTLYQVFSGEKLLGLVHGVNVPGQGGVIQVFLSLDPTTGAIQNFFFQRLQSPVASELKKKEFRDQFKGVTLGDFYAHDFYKSKSKPDPKDSLAKIHSPSTSETGTKDFEASVRGIRKNLVLIDQFFFGNKFEPFYLRAQQSLKQAK